MSYNRRFNARRDEGELLTIEALEKAGWHVWTTLPVDLLLWKPGRGFRVMENKAPGARQRKDQEKQDAFIALTNCPRARTPEQALEALK